MADVLQEAPDRRWNPFAELLRHGRRIGLMTLATVITACLLWLVLPGRYTAKTLLYLPQQQVDPRLQMLTSQLPIGGLNLGGSAPDEQLMQLILESRTLSDSIRARYGKPVDVQTREVEGGIEVQVTYRTAPRAAEAANAYPILINDLAVKIGLNNHERRQEFLRRQLTDAQDRLLRSEQRLVSFQQRHNAPDLEEQSRQTVEAASDLQTRIAQAEIQVSQLRRTLTPDHPALRAAESELAAWRGQLRRLSTGSRTNSILVPLENSPELRAETYRLLRDFKAQEQIFISLAGALAQAEIDGRNNLPVVSVVDPAKVPESRSGPGLVAVLLLSTVLGAVGASAFFLTRAWWRASRRNPEPGGLVAAWNEVAHSA